MTREGSIIRKGALAIVDEEITMSSGPSADSIITDEYLRKAIVEACNETKWFQVDLNKLHRMQALVNEVAKSRETDRGFPRIAELDDVDRYEIIITKALIHLRYYNIPLDHIIDRVNQYCEAILDVERRMRSGESKITANDSGSY